MAETYKGRTDDDLVRFTLDGDEDAFAEIYYRHRQRIANFAYRMLGDRATALDVLQETFQYLFTKLPSYKPEGKLVSLLFLVARNNCLNMRRKSDKFKTGIVDNAGAGEDDSARKPDEEAEDREEKARAVRALDELSPGHREVIELRIIEGLSYAVIADIAGCPEGTVKSRLHNAIENLKKIMKRS